MHDHRDYMLRALHLAEKAEGRTSPNPAVGAVIVRDGRIVGEGYHRKAGSAHAEAVALQQAGSAARGATMYVTLEPCNHFGKTPPCTEAIIAAGIERVFYAVQDSDERVRGSGHQRLQQAGIAVHEGLCREQAEHLNRRYFHYKKTRRPWVFAKFAASLDGKIATRSGESRWITSSQARLRGHELRSRTDAILVGAGTVLADDPKLTCRTADSADSNTPLRVVFDSRGRLPLSAQLFTPELVRGTLIATTASCPADRRDAIRGTGAELVVFSSDVNGRVAPAAVLDFLGERGCTSVLVEGGPGLLGSFFQNDLVDELYAFLAPMIIAGERAPGAVGGEGFASLQQVARLREITIEHHGPDILVRGLIKK